MRRRASRYPSVDRSEHDGGNCRKVALPPHGGSSLAGAAGKPSPLPPRTVTGARGIEHRHYQVLGDCVWRGWVRGNLRARASTANPSPYRLDVPLVEHACALVTYTWLAGSNPVRPASPHVQPLLPVTLCVVGDFFCQCCNRARIECPRRHGIYGVSSHLLTRLWGRCGTARCRYLAHVVGEAYCSGQAPWHRGR